MKQCGEGTRLENVTRVEVIDEYGRQLVRYNCAVQLSLQDEGRTLKLFISKGENWVGDDIKLG